MPHAAEVPFNGVPLAAFLECLALSGRSSFLLGNLRTKEEPTKVFEEREGVAACM